MPTISSSIFIVNNTPFYKGNVIVNKNQLNTYEKLLNNINNVKNTHLDITVEHDNEKRKMSLDVAQLAKDLISEILCFYMSENLTYDKKSMKNREKSKENLEKAYKKTDSAMSEWWRNERKILPSSIIHRAIDNLYRKNKTVVDKETKKELFFLISKNFEINLDNNAAQSSMIQHLQDIPEVIEAINKLNISNNSYLKYEIYCLLAENIYNFLLGNTKTVNFSELKEAIKEINQRKSNVHQNKLNPSPFYPTTALFSHRK